jgi:hypothetical protein
MSSGTYVGVSGHLMIARNVEFLFVSAAGVQHLLPTVSSTLMSPVQATTEIGQFLDRRKNYLTVFNFDVKVPVPDLSSSKRWSIYARDKEGASRASAMFPVFLGHFQ